MSSRSSDHSLATSLGDIALQSKPLLTSDDLVSYKWDDHILTLKPEAIRKIPKPGVFGIPFVVTADGKRAYVAAFWTWISSYLPKLPTLFAEGIPAGAKNTYEIGGPPWQEIPDPRGNPDVKRALQAAGKLR